MPKEVKITIEACTLHTDYIMHNSDSIYLAYPFEKTDEKVVCNIIGCKKEVAFNIEYKL